MTSSASASASAKWRSKNSTNASRPNAQPTPLRSPSLSSASAAWLSRSRAKAMSPDKERDPCPVLLEPRQAALVVEQAVERVGFAEEPLGVDQRATEQLDETAGAQRPGEQIGAFDGSQQIDAPGPAPAGPRRGGWRRGASCRTADGRRPPLPHRRVALRWPTRRRDRCAPRRSSRQAPSRRTGADAVAAAHAAARSRRRSAAARALAASDEWRRACCRCRRRVRPRRSTVRPRRRRWCEARRSTGPSSLTSSAAVAVWWARSSSPAGKLAIALATPAVATGARRLGQRLVGGIAHRIAAELPSPAAHFEQAEVVELAHGGDGRTAG